MGISCITATHDAEEALSYADSILVLKEGDQLACASPRQLYTNPRSAYIAGFFDAISTIPPGLFNNEQALFLYPHQLEISDEPTGLQVKISDSYFKGREYLIRAKSDLGWFYFYHPRALEEGLSLYLRPKGREEC